MTVEELSNYDDDSIVYFQGLSDQLVEIEEILVGNRGDIKLLGY